MPTYQDVIINTRTDPELRSDFVNPFAPGPPAQAAPVTLPDDSVPVFIVTGDSTCLGNTGVEDWSTKGLTPYVERQGDDWPLTVKDGSAYGYFWNKFMDLSGDLSGGAGSETFVKSVATLIDITASGDAFLPVHPRMGGQQLNGNFTYSMQDGGAVTTQQRVNDFRSNASGAPVPDPQANTAVAFNGQPGSITPLWDFARTIKGLFRKADGTVIPPYFIFLASASTRFGHPGNPFGGLGLDYHARYGYIIKDALPIANASVGLETKLDYYYDVSTGIPSLQRPMKEGESNGWRAVLQIQNQTDADLFNLLDLQEDDTFILSANASKEILGDSSSIVSGDNFDLAFQCTIASSSQVRAVGLNGVEFDTTYEVQTGTTPKGSPIYTRYNTDIRWRFGPPELLAESNQALQLISDSPDQVNSMKVIVYKSSQPKVQENEMGYVYRQLRQVYIRPAVDYIMTTLSANPLHVGNVIMMGGIDGAEQYPDSYQVSAGLTTRNIVESYKELLNAATIPPTVQYMPWFTKDTGKTLYPTDHSQTLRKSLGGIKLDGKFNFANLDNLQLAKSENTGVNGVYMTPLSYALYGERLAQAYLHSIASNNTVTAPTMANITQGS